MPNFTDRVIQGYGTRGNVGSYLNESLPNITGMIGNIDTAYGGTQTGCIANDGVSSGYGITGVADRNLSVRSRIDASLSSSTYQNNAPVQPNAILIQCCIKY